MKHEKTSRDFSTNSNAKVEIEKHQTDAALHTGEDPFLMKLYSLLFYNLKPSQTHFKPSALIHSDYFNRQGRFKNYLENNIMCKKYLTSSV